MPLVCPADPPWPLTCVKNGRGTKIMILASRSRSISQGKADSLAISVLLTDLYELTMLQAYFEQRMNGRAVFELFVRKLPPHRNFLVAAGLAQVLDYLVELRLDADDLAWLN